MKVKIRGVEDNAIYEKERLILDVIESTDIGEYIVFDTTYTSDDKVSNKVRHSYWFPDLKVKKGDVVVLYTKKGTHSSKTNGINLTYFFYWNLNVSVWNNEGDCAVLLHCDEWVHKKVK